MDMPEFQEIHLNPGTGENEMANPGAQLPEGVPHKPAMQTLESLRASRQPNSVAQAAYYETQSTAGNQAATAVANTDSVAEWESANRIIKCATDAFGTLHAVVNNAGILRDRFFHKMSMDEWDAVLKVHLYGAFYVSRAAATQALSRRVASTVTK